MRREITQNRQTEEQQVSETLTVERVEERPTRRLRFEIEALEERVPPGLISDK
jgi:hypothetical protein